MAGVVLGDTSVNFTLKNDDDDDLSDARIHQLLVHAEQRLRSFSILPQNAPAASASSCSLTQDNRLLVRRDHDVSSYVQSHRHAAHVDQTLLVTCKERKLASGIRHVEDPVLLKSRMAKFKASSVGAAWFNLPRTNMTPELKRDLQLLRMRSVLDPKRHYKRENNKCSVSEFSQVGTVIEGPTEFFSARLSKKERKQTFVEEVLAAETVTGRFKSKYDDIQKAKTSGKRAFYKAMKAQRSHRRSKS